MKNSGSIFIGIIAAATAGVIIGMLIAPEKGEDLRKNVKDTAGDWAKKLGNLIVDGKEKLTNLTSTLAESENDGRHDGDGKTSRG
ncbi:MAG TPA: YtxH domain-containing protein [Cyclobacteriaceae bacterium]|nr:YtxH domain-containing protein [Cyclobacteriaceae bacterium]